MNNYLQIQASNSDDRTFAVSSDLTPAGHSALSLELSPAVQLNNKASALISREIAKLAILTILVFLLAACSSNGEKSGSASQLPSILAANPSPQTDTAANSATDDLESSTFSGLLDNPQDVLCTADPAIVQQALLQLVNESRNQSRMCGGDNFAPVPPISSQATLQSIANDHSLDMASNNFFSHTGSDGLGVAERASAAGYNWQHISENIAAGHVTTGEVHAGWLSSPGHCVNIMAPQVTEFGAACISNEGSENKRYWSTAFGRQFNGL